VAATSRHTTLLSLVLGSAACAAPAKPAAAGEVWTASATPLQMQLDRSMLATAGVHWVELPPDTTSGKSYRFVIGVPESSEPLAPRPLVVFLHGGGGSRTLAQRIECLVMPAFAELSPIVVAPEGGRGEWWQAEESSLVLGLTQAAARYWPVQENHLVIMGYSNGGIGAWFFARLYPEHFSAAIPMASNHTIVGESPLPVFAIHGSRDELFDVASVQESVAALAARGFDVQLLIKARGTHMEPCAYVPELQTAVQWLEDDVWRPSPQ
jgi:poly(3-hydroxybutyrate) depolymerase